MKATGRAFARAPSPQREEHDGWPRRRFSLALDRRFQVVLG